MWYVPSLDHQTVVRYCHSTPRSLYDMYDHHGGSVVGDALRLGMRTLYQQTTPYADRWLCNSDVVQRRLQGYLAPTAPTQVVYPPVQVDETGPDVAPTQDYLFVVGRLGINKRVDLVRDVAAATDRRVVVAGDGPERETLLDGAPENLEYLAYIDDGEKYRRLSEAAATLFLARHEDFGIVPIESFAAGTPVVGVEEGFTQHQIVAGGNGVLVEPDVDSVVAGIQQVGDVRWSAERIAAYAEQFGTDRFRNEVISAVAAAQRDAAVEPNIDEPEPREVPR
jgi:glycosyltransferase involved in cell wall biosynthesis